MDQSIRFTVLDPLQARLKRHDQLREDINEWDKLVAESKMLRAMTLKMQSSRLEDDDKRAQTETDLYRVAAELQEVEKVLLPQLGKFFESILSSLTPAEREAVAEANQSLSAPLTVKDTIHGVSLAVTPKLIKMSSSTSDGWTEVDGSTSSTVPDGVEVISGSDEEEECNELPVTLEDFETGKAPQVQQVAKKNVKVLGLGTHNDTAKLATLASYPVVTHTEEEPGDRNGEQSSRFRRSTSPSPRTANIQPITPRRTASMFWSIRKTIRGKFVNYSSGEPRIIRQSSAPPIDTSGSASQSAADSPRKHLLIVPQSPTEWLAIEDCLWEIDAREARSPGKSLLTSESISSGTQDLLTGLLQKVCASTPWRSTGIASHYLSADRRWSMYDQLLAKVEVELASGLDTEEKLFSEDDAQLAVWFREIDVDVVRTCHRNIYAKAVDATPSLSFENHNSTCVEGDADSVKTILNEMINIVAKHQGEDSSSSGVPYHTVASTTKNTRNPDLEAKIRRVLRAYVVYNPRVGYCQGMGFLVRLLAEVTTNEADIFWLFVGFSEPENDRNLYEPDMAVLQPYLSKFELLFSTHMPELYAHFQAEGVHVATFCTRWFLTFFSSFETLAPTLVVRLLDIFIIDGWRVMFSVSLVILDELQEQLMKSDMEGILRVLQFPRTYMPDPDQLRQRQLVRHALTFSISRAINSI
ncbi:unnamed protein product [Phytophthora fragariaefolia]|uniref:Unnamed protein product n=1 Tax=Phytophthora fragariaefolia TaxID=1490495 RepID=A0A9W6Y4E8_9STRA|nr:unnamed protein product [Phytophthora fragariaefolia]